MRKRDTLPFSYQHGHKVASFFTPPFCPLSLKILAYPSVQAPELCGISFSLDTDIRPWPLCPRAAVTADVSVETESNPRPNPAVWGTHTYQLCWGKLNISLPCLGAPAEHTCVCWSLLAFSMWPAVGKEPMPSLSAAVSFSRPCQAQTHAAAAISVAQERGKNSTWYL